VFIVLLVVTFTVSAIACVLVAQLFRQPIDTILSRIVSPELSSAWLRYLQFAIFVVGISGGCRVWELEKYVTGRGQNGIPVDLNRDRWVLEVYRTVIETLQSIAWMLLVFFVFALIAYVVMRGFELRSERQRS
jgi:hypothetical protein